LVNLRVVEPGRAKTVHAEPVRAESARAYDMSTADNIYPVLFFGGLAALVASQLFRVVAVRRLFGR
jgi:hypothetical protein